MLTYIGIPKDSDFLSHYGRLGMKWYQHIFGDDPRWGSNGRAKGAMKGASKAKPKTKNGIVKGKPMDILTAVKDVNREGWEAGWDDWNEAYKIGRGKNCVSCIFAYDLRRRGYKVKSVPGVYLNLMKAIKNVYGMDPYSKEFQEKTHPKGLNGAGSLFSPPISAQSMRAMEKALPKNARGFIDITRPGAAGHVMNWETVDGKLRYVDGQIGRELNEGEFLYYYGRYNLVFYDLSKLTVKEDTMTEFVEKNDR